MNRPHIVLLTSDDLPLPYNLDEITRIAHVTVTGKEELPAALPAADGVFLWDFFSDALESAWASARNVEWVHVAAAGVDAVMFDDLRRSTVTLTNAHGIFDQPIAEFVLASILAHDKQVHLSKRLQQTGIWKHRELRRTAGSNVLIVGTGGIGRAVARLMTALGMNVRGAGRRALAEDPDFGTVVSSAELPAHVPWADHVVLAAPLTQQTERLIGAETLTAMKSDAHLINIGRGALIDELALLQALWDQTIAHASLDVFTEEPLPVGHPFWALNNVTVSAHLSGDVRGWRDALADQFLRNLELYAAGLPFGHEVDKTLGYVPG